MDTLPLVEIVRDKRISCPEHEVWLSFFSDDDAISFRDWWREQGRELFEAWWKQSRPEEG